MSEFSSEFERAISVFVHGFAFTRSFTHPYRVETLSEGVWALRDAPRSRGDYRTDEVVAAAAADIPVAELDALARTGTRGRFRVCYLLPAGDPDAAMRAAFKALGYRLMATEALMIHRLTGLTPIAAAPYPVTRLTTGAQAERLTRAAGRRQILPEHLPEHLSAEPAPMRQYMALDGEAPVGWVGSVVVGDCSWCTSMFVRPTYRRRGIGRALLNRMLADDRDAGAEANVLLASHAGAKLYPAVGYETLGTLYMFTPPKPPKEAAQP